MAIYKKKGSIIPKRFLASVEKKGQHVLKFGCDVKIVGNVIYPLTQGCVFLIPHITYVNLKKNKGNNKKRWKGCVMTGGVYVDGSLCEGGSGDTTTTMIHIEIAQPTIKFDFDYGINTDYNLDC